MTPWFVHSVSQATYGADTVPISWLRDADDALVYRIYVEFYNVDRVSYSINRVCFALITFVLINIKISLQTKNHKSQNSGHDNISCPKVSSCTRVLCVQTADMTRKILKFNSNFYSSSFFQFLWSNSLTEFWALYLICYFDRTVFWQLQQSYKHQLLYYITILLELYGLMIEFVCCPYKATINYFRRMYDVSYHGNRSR